jgi:hypothetical protein
MVMGSSLSFTPTLGEQATAGIGGSSDLPCGFSATGIGVATDVALLKESDDLGMKKTYGVVWRDGALPLLSGKLEFFPRALRLDGTDISKEIPYETIVGIRAGRSAEDRVDGRPSVVVEQRKGNPVRISTVAQPSLVGEIAERLAALQLDVEVVRRVTLVVPLKPGSRDAVRGLLETGPPIEPTELPGLDRHEVFLTTEEAVFVFESHLSLEALAPLLAEPNLWAAVGEWQHHVAGPPRIAEAAYSWTRREAANGLSYLPTPGPGDSEGGDIF